MRGVNIIANKTTAQKIADAAKTYKGVPYKWGGQDRTGIDCSGLVIKSSQDAGVPIKDKTADELYTTEVRSIPKDQRKSGDLVFFDYEEDGKKDHVGIYTGNGKIVHASGSQKQVVEVNVDTYFKTPASYGRLLPRKSK